MNAYLTALRSELFLAWRSRGVRVLLLVPPLAAFARIALARASAAGNAARDALLGGADASAAVERTAYGPFVDGMRTGLTLGFIALVALAAASIAGDRDTGVLRHALVRRVGRTSLVLGKFTMLVIVGLLMPIAVGLAAWYTADFFYDFVAYVEDGYEMVGVAEMEEYIKEGLALAIVPLPAVVAFGMVISTCARSATEAVAAALGATLVFDLFKELLGDASYWCWARYVPSLVDESYLRDVGRLARGFNDVFVEDGVRALNAIAPIPESMVLLALAVFVARRRRM